MKICATANCPNLTDSTRCDQHRKTKQNTDRARNPRNDYGPEWPNVRARQLRHHPDCAEHGCTSPATVVDHIIPLRFFAVRSAAHAPTNLQSLCKPHHDRKTVIEDGGFGRAPSPKGGGVPPGPDGVSRSLGAAAAQPAQAVTSIPRGALDGNHVRAAS